MDKKKVYVSSTYIDLIDHRLAVKTALERAQYDVECMEKYPAFDERPQDKCLADVADCDFYVLLLAWRYGFRPADDNPDNLSITHLEYRQAVRCGKKPLVFLLDPNHDWKRRFIDPDSFSPGSPVAVFRDEVGKSHGLSFFTDPHSLSTAVLQALRAQEQTGLSNAARSNAHSQPSPKTQFDVFLSHNNKDKSAVLALAKRLRAQGVKVWLDTWELRPGHPWQEALEDIIKTTRIAAVLIGVDGFGPWEDVEMRACLTQFVRRKLPVIPVLLPDCPEKPDLPLLLQEFIWVDMRDTQEEEGFQRLMWGITGNNPNLTG